MKILFLGWKTSPGELLACNTNSKWIDQESLEISWTTSQEELEAVAVNCTLSRAETCGARAKSCHSDDSTLYDMLCIISTWREREPVELQRDTLNWLMVYKAYYDPPHFLRKRIDCHVNFWKDLGPSSWHVYRASSYQQYIPSPGIFSAMMGCGCWILFYSLWWLPQV